MVGPGIDRITPDIQDKLASLLDLLPATATINVQTDAGYVTVSRDWPSHRMETVDSLVDEIAAAPGITHIALPASEGQEPLRAPSTSGRSAPRSARSIMCAAPPPTSQSEESRVGHGGVRTVRSGGSADHSKKKYNQK